MILRMVSKLSLAFWLTSTLTSLVLLSTTANANVALKPAMRGCPSSGYLRLVNVSSASQLSSALSSAQAGDQIRLAAGIYNGGFHASKSGTASAPITICGVKGIWPVITGSTFVITGAYLNLSGLVFAGPNGDNNNGGIMNTHDILFTYNEVRNGTWHAGIAVDTDANVEISHNFIHDNGKTRIDHGIYYRHQAGKNIIANNVFYNNFGRGISMHDNEGDAISDTTVINNTLVKNGTCGIQLGVNAGTHNVIANNVLSENGWREGEKQIRIVVGASGMDAGGNSIMNNIVWSASSSLAGIDLEVSGDALSQNLVQDPMFVSNYSDLHLKSGSPAIGLALASYSTVIDKDDKVRDSSPDAGAYEYGGLSASPTPTPTPAPSPSPTPKPSPTPTPAPSPSPAPTSKTLIVPVSADAYVNSAYPNVNRGSKTFVAIDNSPKTDSLFKFVVSGIGSSTVKSVKLRLVPTGTGASSGGDVHLALSNNWTETAVTWNTAPVASSTILASQGPTLKKHPVYLDVSSAVKSDGTYSFRMTNSVNDGNNYDYYAREAGVSLQPELIIELN